MKACLESERTPSQRYPQVWHAGRPVSESRVVWERAHGAITEGLFVLHRCDNPRCILLEHLFLGTPLDNMRDKVAKGRHSSQLKTCCPQGHPYTEENTYRPPNRNERQCRTCIRARGRAA